MNAAARTAGVRKALRLEFLTVGWNIVEGIIAVTAALTAGSVALLGFGIDSFVETASAAILIWRLRAERAACDAGGIDALDRRARRWVAASLVLLAAWIAFDSTTALWHAEKPETSIVGIALTSVSLVVMQVLARAKRRAATALGSRAMEADAFQTTACWWLSVITLGGLALNAALGWWWADPVAALGAAVFILKEAREAWRGEDECCGRGCS